MFDCSLDSVTALYRIAPLTVFLLGFAVRPAWSQACKPASDSASVILLANMRHVASSAAPWDSVSRLRSKLPRAAASDVFLVQQNTVCEKALAAFKAAFRLLSPVPTTIAVVKVGTVYVAMHPTNTDGWPHVVLDSTYAVLAKFPL
jgi:hypothetical protein